MAAANFNCTIQELKPSITDVAADELIEFQLHHTGIKTRQGSGKKQTAPNFNCTIQELKR